jgi:tryptophan halogenase
LRVIDWTPYYHEEMWQSNVVSIGLSAGFIEPLESTGVALICAGIWQLAKRLTPGGYGIKEIAVFNAEMFAFFENAVDFVNMHYYNSNRSGKFWEWVKKNHQVSDTQKFYEYLLDKDQYKMPQGGNEMFSGENWAVWLSQLGSKISPKKDGIVDNQSRQMVLDFYKHEIEKRTKLVHHSDFIEQFKENFKTGG